MGTQDPGDLGMQEGSLSSNDIKTGSISHKVFLSEAGDRPLSTSSSTESICAGDSLNTEALAAHLHEDIFFLPSVRSVQDDSQDPGMSQPGGHIYLFLCCTGWCSLWAHLGGGVRRAHSHCSCRILSVTAKHLFPRAFLVGLWNASVPKEELEILEDDPPWLLEKEHSLAGPQRPGTDRKPWRPSLQQTRSHMEFQYVCPPSTLESDHFLPCKSLHSLWILSASSCAWQDRFNDIYT